MQPIDHVRLRTAAKRPEWALLQHADEAYALALLQSLEPLLEAAKAERIQGPIDQQDVPETYNFGDERFSRLQEPNVDNAYSDFATELAGGLSERERELIDRLNSSSALDQGGDL